MCQLYQRECQYKYWKYSAPVLNLGEHSVPDRYLVIDIISDTTLSTIVFETQLYLFHCSNIWLEPMQCLTYETCISQTINQYWMIKWVEICWMIKKSNNSVYFDNKNIIVNSRENSFIPL